MANTIEDKVIELKNKGNSALNSGNNDEAIKFYTEAIELDPLGHVLYSNRSAAYCKASKYKEALEDAKKCIAIKPDWSKGYSRKGAALAYMKVYNEAIDAYNEALSRDADNVQLKDALKEVRATAASKAANPFSDPELLANLAKDPRTSGYLKDPSYLTWLKNIQTNPSSLTLSMNDPRTLATLNVLLGIDTSKMEEDLKSSQQSESKSATPKADPEPMEVDPEADAKKEAFEHKEKGNGFYKKKEFEQALEHYGKAIELDPINMTYYNNRAAVYFEQKKFEDCIEECKKAVDIGRENRADFKIIARAYTRMGAAFLKLNNLLEARNYYRKSLTEHRLPEVVKKLSEIEKIIKEEERKAFIDPEKSLEEKNKGNEYFKTGDYPKAMKCYTQAIMRNPDDAKLYSNRAACYQKLAEFELALRDSEQCIKLDADFVKGHIRKGMALFAMKENSRAASAFQKALELDANSQEAIEGYRKAMVAQNSNPDEVRKQAMSDPEIQQIFNDPAMRLILEQMQNDPKALHEHLKNPHIAAKIQKLLESGLIAIR